MKNRLKEERVSQKISQIELASGAGVSRQSIHAIETGKYVPSTELALRISRILGKKVEDLFFLD